MTRSPTRTVGRAGRAFTLVELLVVLAVIGVLLALLLPAVQAARESARRAACRNHLRQISLGLLTHHDVIGRFPSGGWGREWVGVPGRGTGVEQPGGWAYNVLPFLEEGAVHDLGEGMLGLVADEAYSRRLQTPIKAFVCPSRRSEDVWAVAQPSAHVRSPKPHGQVTHVARADYAINGGTSHVFDFPGPPGLSVGSDESFWTVAPNVSEFTGICHLRIGVTLSSVVDGTSKTYLVGEKFVNPEHYEDGRSPGDNESLYAGYCTDLHRFAGNADRPSPYYPPHADSTKLLDPSGHTRFGSAHAGGFHMAYCDGSAHFIDYAIEPRRFFLAGHRKDGGQVE